MSEIFPSQILCLPRAEIAVPGAEAFISQADDHQILFMQFSQDAEIPEHAHECQWGLVVEGKIDLVVEGVLKTFRKGDRYLIPAWAKHSAKIYAGYADVTFFASASRYRTKSEKSC